MSNKADVGGNVPKLRFPEFRDAREWDERLLGDVFDFHSTANNSRADLSNSGDTFYIHYGDIHTKFHICIDFSKDDVPRIQSGKYGKASLLKNGDLIVADASEDTDGIAKAVEVRGLKKGIKAIAGLHTILLRDSENIYVTGFRGLLREIEKVKTQIRRLAVGVKVYAVSKTVLKQVLLPLPTQPEQQKIADCLSSIDELLAEQTRKLDALKAHKKGLMQQLFPAEGKTVPKLRFPEFCDAPPEWEEKLLNQVASYENGKAHEKRISESGKYIVVNSKFISTDGEVRKYSEEAFCIADTGDILMVLSDVPNGRAIVKCYFVESDDLYAVNQRICKIRSKKIDGKFLFYVLDRNPYFLAFDDGVKQTNLRKEDVLNCPVSLPALLNEQKKISDLISSIDDLIAAQTQKIETLKAHKKGLMQRLFPSDEEASS
jgi:type I restriction enzyme S subunit